MTHLADYITLALTLLIVGLAYALILRPVLLP
jgi:hypothetical protein